MLDTLHSPSSSYPPPPHTHLPSVKIPVPTTPPLLLFILSLLPFYLFFIIFIISLSLIPYYLSFPSKSFPCLPSLRHILFFFLLCSLLPMFLSISLVLFNPLSTPWALVHKTTYAPKIYTALCIMLLIRGSIHYLGLGRGLGPWGV
jgi:hypothetical protein